MEKTTCTGDSGYLSVGSAHVVPTWDTSSASNPRACGRAPPRQFGELPRTSEASAAVHRPHGRCTSPKRVSTSTAVPVRICTIASDRSRVPRCAAIEAAPSSSCSDLLSRRLSPAPDADTPRLHGAAVCFLGSCTPALTFRQERSFALQPIVVVASVPFALAQEFALEAASFIVVPRYSCYPVWAKPGPQETPVRFRTPLCTGAQLRPVSTFVRLKQLSKDSGPENTKLSDAPARRAGLAT